MRLWFSTPAYQRYELTDIVLEHRAQLRDALSPDIELNCVVIADDDNVATARKHGFDVIDAPNKQLGWKWNQGAIHAYQHGADYICGICTDSLVSEEWVRSVDWEREVVHSGHLFVAVDPQGCTSFYCRNVFGTGPVFVPRRYAEPFGGSIFQDHSRELLLHQSWFKIESHFGAVEHEFTDVSDFQFPGIFLPGQDQVTDYQDYVNCWGVKDVYPLSRFADEFPGVSGRLSDLY